MINYPTLPPDGIEGKIIGSKLNRKWKERTINHKTIAQRFLIGKSLSKSKLNDQYEKYIANLSRSNIVTRILLFITKKVIGY